MDDQTGEAQFRSPPRTLIPKLVRSRDNWKAKANLCTRVLKKAQVRARDLTLSRTRWRQRAEQAEQELLAARQQLQQAQQHLQQALDEATSLRQQEEKNFAC